jgi:sensor c-di-GMP phosphodiesterase-like protein
VQGWHLSRAMPVTDLVPWLHAREARRPALRAL